MDGEETPLILEGIDGQLIVMSAFRYALGRRSHIVGTMIRWLQEHWSGVEAETRNVIIRDVVEALMDGLAGDKGDATDWKHFAEWAWQSVDERGRDWIKAAVAYKDKPWPLDVE